LQIFEAVSFLASKNILHRDIKEPNILVDSHNNLRIIDFGSSCGIYQAEPLAGSYKAIDNERTPGPN
jgi:serine/threonine protein kinase